MLYQINLNYYLIKFIQLSKDKAFTQVLFMLKRRGPCRILQDKGYLLAQLQLHTILTYFKWGSFYFLSIVLCFIISFYSCFFGGWKLDMSDTNTNGHCRQHYNCWIEQGCDCRYYRENSSQIYRQYLEYGRPGEISGPADTGHLNNIMFHVARD